jgi:hypothetical protein
MKDIHKPVLVIIAMLLLQACSALDFIPGSAPADTPVPSSTITSTPTNTLTPTHTTTPTPRDTVTPIGAIPTFTPFILVSPASDAPIPGFIATPDLPTGGFESVSLSQGKIFYGSCKQNYIKMTITVDNPLEVKRVYRARNRGILPPGVAQLPTTMEAECSTTLSGRGTFLSVKTSSRPGSITNLSQ